ncbi:MAG: hypothetical protein E7426_07640, partial [Ruminococcaceae bacterium]|nr:hypothetical protein [Oscillospiraceae bacterium]
MRKRALSLFLALVMCLSLVTPAYAVELEEAAASEETDTEPAAEELSAEEAAPEATRPEPAAEPASSEQGTPATTVVASGTCGAEDDNLTWTLDDAGTLTVSGTGEMAGYHYGINEPAPWGDYRDSITAVVIENGVTTIGSFAFGYCANLQSASIPDSVTFISEWAFYQDSALESVTIPGSVKELDREVFYQCTGLRSVTLEEGVETVGRWTFSDCEGLETLVLPTTLQTVDEGGFAFYSDNTNVYITDLAAWCDIDFADGSANPLSPDKQFSVNTLYLNGEPVYDLELPEGVSTIKPYAFYSYMPLNSVTFSDTVTEIGASAFERCDNLRSVEITDGVVTVGANAFCYCTALETLTVGDTVTTIGECAFEGDIALKKVTLGTGLQTLGSMAFGAGGNILSGNVYLPVTFLGDAPQFSEDCFYNNYILARYPADNETWTEDVRQQYAGTVNWRPVGAGDLDLLGDGTFGDGLSWALTAGGTLTISGTGPMPNFELNDGGTAVNAPWGTLSEQVLRIEIEPGVTAIGEWAFFDCENAESAILADSVTEIGYAGFMSCSQLKILDLGTGLQYLGDSAFAWCSSLESVTLPESMISIGNCAFRECTALAEITMPTSLTLTWTQGGTFSGCTSLRSIVLPEGIEELGSYEFENCTALESVTLPSTLTQISPNDFENCTSLQYITLPDGLKRIQEQAFKGCTSLQNVTIPESVSGIGSSVFQDCTSLTEVTVPRNANLNGSTFKGCTGLRTAVLDCWTTYLPQSTFDGCTALESVTLQSGATSIYPYAFRGCTSLRSLTLPDGVKKVLNNAFEGSGLTAIELPAVLTEVQTDTFKNCADLQEITFRGNAPTIEENAFNGVTATARYPYGDETWTDGMFQDYGGSLTWKSYNASGESYLNVTPEQSVYDVVPGESITMRVLVESTSAVSGYEWSRVPWDRVNSYDYSREETIAGADTDTLTVDSVNGKYLYRCRVSNDEGYSSTVDFYVNVDNQLTVTDSWLTVPAAAGGSVTLTAEVTALDTSDIHYVWSVETRFDAYDDSWTTYGHGYDDMGREFWTHDEPVANAADSNTLVIDPVTKNARYRCEIFDKYGNGASILFDVVVENELSIGAAGSRYVSAAPHGDAVLQVIPYGIDLAGSAYQWFEKNTYDTHDDTWRSWGNNSDGSYWHWDPIDGATADTYTVQDVTARKEYQCTLTDRFGNEATLEFVVRIENYINFKNYSERFYAEPGGSVTLRAEVTAVDMTGMTYQWMTSSGVIEGATSPTLTLQNVTRTEDYRCVATDAYGNSGTGYYMVYVSNRLIVTPVEPVVMVLYGQDAMLEINASCLQGDITYIWHDENGRTVAEGVDLPSFTVENVTAFSTRSCHVQDEYGNGMTVTFRVGVENGFYARAKQAFFTVPAGSDVTLEVEAGANEGAIQYIWNGNEENTASSAYTVTNVQYASYPWCQVKDQYGNMEFIRFHIEVEGETASGYYYNDTVSAAYGARVELTALPGITLSEDAVITWARADNSVEMPNYQVIDDADTTTLVIDRLEKAGSYRCMVNGGQYVHTFTVEVENGFRVEAEEDVFALAGESATLTVNATVTSGPLRYYWYDFDTRQEVEGTASFITPALTGYTRSFRCRVVDQYDNMIQANFTVYRENHFGVTVLGGYETREAPIAGSVFADTSTTEYVVPAVRDGEVTIAVQTTADDLSAITRSWYILDAYGEQQVAWNNDSLTIPHVTHDCYVLLTVSDCGGALQKQFQFAIEVGAAAPEITAEPVSVTVNEGKTATFTVSATGAGLSYQWWYLKPGSDTWTKVSSNGTSATYSLTTAARHNGYQYKCEVSNAAGYVYTDIRTLTVVAKPTVTTQPKNVSVAEGKTAKFTVVASGTSLSYQWYYRTSS